MKKNKFLRLALSTSMILSTAAMTLSPVQAFAQEEEMTQMESFTLSENSQTDINETLSEEEKMILASDLPATYREGTDVNCDLTIDTLVDGTPMDSLLYQPGKGPSQVQIGGDLDMTNVWNNYRTFRLAYIMANSKPQFYTKSLKGSYTYTFQINPEIVSVNEDILCDTSAWQKVFEEGSGAAAEGFFKFMKCTQASYDATTGTITVRFEINENGTGKVSCKTLDDDKTTQPKTIHAYSPEGALFIKDEDFQKGGQAILSTATFHGNIDLDPWMALIVPIRFTGVIDQTGLELDVPSGKVAFHVENGTWDDGSADAKVVEIDMDMVKTNDGAHAAGTLDASLIPTGMVALEGFDQSKGRWTEEINTDENGIVLSNEEYDAAYTYTFDKTVDTGGEEEVGPTVNLYRVYNPNTGEHLFTQDVREKNYLAAIGWYDEGLAWVSPETSSEPVYRLYNPNNGDHHFTLDEQEMNVLTDLGWKYEGIAWYSNPLGKGVPVFRTYNPNADQAGSHHFTTSRKENVFLISSGWLGEGVAWWVVE